MDQKKQFEVRFQEEAQVLLRVYDSPDWNMVQTYIQEQLDGTMVELIKPNDLPKTSELRGFIHGLRWVLDHKEVVRNTLKQLTTSQEPVDEGE